MIWAVSWLLSDEASPTHLITTGDDVSCVQNDHRTGRKIDLVAAAIGSRTTVYHGRHLALYARGTETKLAADGNHTFLGVVLALQSLHVARVIQCRELRGQVV